MEATYPAYFQTLNEVSRRLEQLSQTAKKKTAAVRADDLATLNETMKEEQAISMSLRGLEQKREQLVKGLNLPAVPLSQLPTVCPREFQLEAKNTAQLLLRNYELYQSASEVARSTLECNLHEIEKLLESAGADPAGAADYGAAPVELPPAMRTDFRA